MGRTDVRVAVATAVAFVVLTVLVMTGWQPLAELDRAVADRTNTFATAHPGWVQTLKVVTNVAGPLTWRVLLVVLAGWLLLRRATQAAAFTLAATVGAGVLSTAVKVGVDRSRPVVPHPHANAAGMAFPSGHASTAAVASGVLLLLALPRLADPWRVPAWLLAVAMPVAVGYTRLGLDVHWTSDVLGGWLLGVAAVATAHAAFLRVRSDEPAR